MTCVRLQSAEESLRQSGEITPLTRQRGGASELLCNCSARRVRCVILFEYLSFSIDFLKLFFLYFVCIKQYPREFVLFRSADTRTCNLITGSQRSSLGQRKHYKAVSVNGAKVTQYKGHIPWRVYFLRVIHCKNQKQEIFLQIAMRPKYSH